jgi:hypothetical protein
MRSWAVGRDGRTIVALLDSIIPPDQQVARRTKILSQHIG